MSSCAPPNWPTSTCMVPWGTDSREPPEKASPPEEAKSVSPYKVATRAGVPSEERRFPPPARPGLRLLPQTELRELPAFGNGGGSVRMFSQSKVARGGPWGGGGGRAAGGCWANAASVVTALREPARTAAPARDAAAFRKRRRFGRKMES